MTNVIYMLDGLADVCMDCDCGANSKTEMQMLSSVTE